MVFRRIAAFDRIYRSEVKIGGFLFALLLSGIASGLYKGVQDNFLAEIVQIDAFGRGVTEFFRELPGLLLVLFLAWMYRFSENRVFKIGIGLMIGGLVGLSLAGFLPTAFFPGMAGKAMVIALLVLYSCGEHIIMPVRSTISLGLAQKDKGGAALGITSALMHGGNIVGLLIVTVGFLTLSRIGITKFTQFRLVFAVAMFLMIGTFLISMAMQDSGEKVKRRRFYFDKKFSKFYMLEVFYGSRKQVFMTFAPYVLILNYGADTSTISLLLAVSAVCTSVLSPFIGRLIDRVGYKAVMVGDTLVLIVVCFFYGFAHRIFPIHIAFYVVCINYVLDAIISVASMASSVYVQEIADSQEEITATLSTGISVNHLISIIIALLGGFIWIIAGIELLFSISAILGILNSLYAASIKVQKHYA